MGWVLQVIHKSRREGSSDSFNLLQNTSFAFFLLCTCLVEFLTFTPPYQFLLVYLICADHSRPYLCNCKSQHLKIHHSNHTVAKVLGAFSANLYTELYATTLVMGLYKNNYTVESKIWWDFELKVALYRSKGWWQRLPTFCYCRLFQMLRVYTCASEIKD